MDNKPLVSIGLPVYNGENFLEEAIHSILNQTFTDFELIISDNGSTDRTEDICRHFAKLDKRIKYYQSQNNQGASWNFNNTFHLSQGTYFKWAAHDDIIEPFYLEKCVSVLENHKEYVGCSSHVKVIDSEGVERSYDTIELENKYSSSAAKRFLDYMSFRHMCYDAFALFRKSAMEKTTLIAPFFSSDRLFLAQIVLYGIIYHIPETLFVNRDHKDRSIKRKISASEWFDPNSKSSPKYIYLNLYKEYIKSILRARIELKEKFYCLYLAVSYVFKNWNKIPHYLPLKKKKVLPKTSKKIRIKHETTINR